MAIKINLKVIVFDLDGTLVNLPIDWELVKADIDQPAEQSLGSRIEELIVAGDTKTLAKITSHEMSALGEAFINPETKEVFHRLETGFKLAILTRNSRYVAEEFLRLCNLDPSRYLIVGREDVSKLKPHPEGLGLILDKLHTLSVEALLIGDTHHDIDLAHKHGLYSILIGDKTNIDGKEKAFRASDLSGAVEIIHNIIGGLYD